MSIAVTRREFERARSALHPRLVVPPRGRLRAFALVCLALTLLLTVDAALNERAAFDLWLITAAQRIDAPYLDDAVTFVNAVTNSFWAPLLWAMMVLALLGARWWLTALIAAAMPAGGAINHAIGVYLSIRMRPAGDEIERTLGEWNAPSFPSGHVMGAVMLYGFLLYLAPRVRTRLLRFALQVLAIAMIASVGFARLWVGAHWPSDVIAAYALGGCALAILITMHRQLGTMLMPPDPMIPHGPRDDQ